MDLKSKGDGANGFIDSMLTCGHNGEVQIFILDLSTSRYEDVAIKITLNDGKNGHLRMGLIEVEARITPSLSQYLKGHLYGKMAILEVENAKRLTSTLKKNLAQNLALSLAREKMLTNAPTFGNEATAEKCSDRTKINAIDVNLALDHHWLHLITGLILNEVDQSMLIRGVIPYWCKKLVRSVQVHPFSIEQLH